MKREQLMAIDPGTRESAILLWDGQTATQKAILPNEAIRLLVSTHSGRLAIEKPQCMGMPVGAEVFDTCIWIGRFDPECRAVLVTRNEIKMYLCGSMRAKDANIRQALIDRFGAPGTKANPGALYGIKTHLWAALAVAVTVWDRGH
jgi:hypothetical protein